MVNSRFVLGLISMGVGVYGMIRWQLEPSLPLVEQGPTNGYHAILLLVTVAWMIATLVNKGFMVIGLRGTRLNVIATLLLLVWMLPTLNYTSPNPGPTPREIFYISLFLLNWPIVDVIDIFLDR